MIKNTILLLSNIRYTNYIVTKYFLNNQILFDDNQFIKQLFISYCINSNQMMAEYLCGNNSILDNCLFDSTYYSDTLITMCKNSSYQIIKWYYEKFSRLIDLSNMSYIFESTKNQNTDVFKYVLFVSKNFYSQNQYEKIFIHCVKNFNIQYIKLIYQEFPNINFMILNGISLHNSLDIYTPTNMFMWLKEIGNEHNYEVKVELDNTLVVNKKINIYQIDKDLIEKFNKLGTNMISEECIICLNKQTNIITNCGHKFCQDCIKSWCNKIISCPTCRNSDTNIKFYLIKT